MAGNESTTELFSGWSSVVHQPCEEPEEYELPSTVDMAAFTSTGLNVDPSTNNTSHNNDNSDSDSESDVDSSNSGSGASQSESDSSDTDSSTSSQESSSRSPSPEFSVTSTQTNGLRLTIATVKKTTSNPPSPNEKAAATINDKIQQKTDNSTSECSSDSNSDTDDDCNKLSNTKISSKCVRDNNNIRKVVSRLRTRIQEKKDDRKCTTRKETNIVNKMTTTNSRHNRLRQKKTKKMASLPVSRRSTYSSSDSDDSDADSAMLASCSLQEIRQEDLAAILPDQQECDAFADFECGNNNNNTNSGRNGVNNNDVENKNSPSQAGDMSGSDMELPQQAVNALIQRTTESSSESESHAPPNPSTLYANSLLQQFVAQTQMLSAPCPLIQQNNDGLIKQIAINNADMQNSSNNNNISGNNSQETDAVKRKRGRPRKTNGKDEKLGNKCLNTDYCNGDPNVSPDSGIQNSPDHVASSPEPNLSPNVKLKTSKDEKKTKTIILDSKKADLKCDKLSKSLNKSKDISKLSVTSNRFDRLLYGNTDRVLYPPRRKVGRPPMKKGPGRPPKLKTNEIKQPEKIIDKTLKLNNNNNNKNEIRPVLATKNKCDNTKIKYQTLKNLKVMHSKHKHKKHKKYKFKILKPLTTQINDPKVNIEIDKLIGDFLKYCVIGSVKPPKENVPESLKPVKKVSKKRKTTEHSERKKKKISVNATVSKLTNGGNINEQRLPLKKRHYLYSDGKSNVKQPKVEEDTLQKDEECAVNNTASPAATTPKKRHRLEAVSKESPITSPLLDNQKNKPKLSLECLISELKMKRTISVKNPTNDAAKKLTETLEKSEIGTPSETKVKEDLKMTVTETVKKKIRKRRAINRTGFPTIKKKKKKIVSPEVVLNNNNNNNNNNEDKMNCDRVPKEGEEYNKFIQRTEKTESIDDTDIKIEDGKWDAMSECDSLPQDERIELTRDDDDDIDNMLNDDDNLEELSLEASIERLRSRLDKKNNKRKRSSEKTLDGNLNGYPKRRLRDISPASSVDSRKFKDERASASGDEVKKSKKAPRWRKKYLVAGLFSGYYKEDDETALLRRHENAVKSRFIYNPEEHPYGLLPPPYHCGKYLRCRRLPFQLPYDLWWQHTHSQLPGRDIVPSWNYRKIRTNVYNIKTTAGSCEPQSCNCNSQQSGCGDDCINRLVLSECPANNHRCQNQKIQRHEWAPGIEKFMTESKGWGVRTKLPIKSGDFILEYVGEVVSDQEFKERMATIYINDTHHYCLHLDGGLVIDGHRMGGDGRFVNHSCEPNCEMQKWSVNGQFRMALFALRDINEQEELTYDYNFSLFNPAEGQECKCGSEMCRGVIGGKSQRIIRQLDLNNKNSILNNNNNSNLNNNNPGRVGRPRKNQAKRTTNNNLKDLPIPQPTIPVQQQQQQPPQLQLKPISHQQKCFVLEHHCFLLRNLSKVRKLRDRSNSSTLQLTRQQTSTPTTFINHLNALEKPRNMRTRRLAQAEDDPELNKTVKLASVLKDIWNIVTKAKDENNELLSGSFMNVPTKRKLPEFYQIVTNPIDLQTIEQNIATGVYLTADSFNADMNRLFTNYIRFYGRTNETGIAAIKLKKIYVEAKQESLPKFENILGTKPPSTFVSNKNKSEEEDIIRCICGMPRDEGLMIQCERCLVWQHSECVKADVSAASYHCEQCVPREVDYEIEMDEFTEHGHRYYMTLLRGDLQLRQGDTVYVLRDIPIPGTDKKHTYDTIGKIDYSELDIFRVERLWKDSKTGQRFAYGHHYLRPHETYHEPTRKFFPNEVMRVPLYEAVPVELIISHCWVMDLNTFCKGRPIGAPEEHIYICEYRVDKSARLFSKVSKSKFPICTKSFVFERFETRLKVSRTYTPHDLDPALIKPRGRKPQENEDNCSSNINGGKEMVTALPVHVPVVRTPMEQKTRLNKILLNLLSKMPTKQVLDVSYLLEGGRRRKKQQTDLKN